MTWPRRLRPRLDIPNTDASTPEPEAFALTAARIIAERFGELFAGSVAGIFVGRVAGQVDQRQSGDGSGR
jgi:hypothetical protein